MKNIIQVFVKVLGLWFLFQFINYTVDLIMRFNINLTYFLRIIIPLILFIIFILLWIKNRKMTEFILDKTNLANVKINIENVTVNKFIKIILRFIALWILFILIQKLLNYSKSSQINLLIISNFIGFIIMYVLLWFYNENFTNFILKDETNEYLNSINYNSLEKLVLSLTGIVIIVRFIPEYFSYIIYLLSNHIKYFLQWKSIEFLKLFSDMIKRMSNPVALSYIIKIIIGIYLIIDKENFYKYLNNYKK